MEAELDVDSHERLATCVSYMVEEHANRYEKGLVLIGRYTLITATKQQNQLIEGVVQGFVNRNHLVDGYDGYDAVSLHQILLVFLRDWFVASDLEDSLLKFLDRNVQVLMNRSGWADMEFDQQLFAVLIDAFDQFTSLSPNAYSAQLIQALQPWMTNNVTKIQFYRACTSLRERVMDYEQTYIRLFRSVNWHGMKQDLQRELDGEQH